MLAKKVMGAGGAGGGYPTGPFTNIFTGSIYGDIAAADVSNPASLSQTSYVGGYGEIRGLRVNRATSVVFASDRNNGLLRAIDVSNPSSISQISSKSGYSQARFVDLDTSAKVAFIDNNSLKRLYAVDVSNPASMVDLSFVSYADTQYFGAYDQTNKILFRTTGLSQKIQIFDASNPSSMALLIEWSPGTNQWPYGIAVDEANQVAFYADYNSPGYLRSFDYSTPGSPSLLGFVNIGAYGQGVAIDLVNRVCYVALLNSNTISAVDISNPSSMSLLGTLTVSLPYQLELDVDSGVLYCAGRSYGLGITSIDVSNPASMTVLDTLTSTQIDYLYSVGGL